MPSQSAARVRRSGCAVTFTPDCYSKMSSKATDLNNWTSAEPKAWIFCLSASFAAPYAKLIISEVFGANWSLSVRAVLTPRTATGYRTPEA